MRNDDSTITTFDTLETESLATTERETGGGSGEGTGGRSPSLSISATPLRTTIGVDATGGDGTNLKMTTTDFCVSLTAGEVPERDEARAPVDIIVVLDKSSSMSTRSKLDLCKKTLETLLRQLLPQDRFGLITYSNDARIDVPIQKMTPQHKAFAMQTIKGVRSSGMTNMSSALGLSAQEIRNSIQQANPVQTVFFLTDGQANVGISDVPGLVKLVQNCFNNQDDHRTHSTNTSDLAPDTELFRSISIQNASDAQSLSFEKESMDTRTTTKSAPKKEEEQENKPRAAGPSNISLHTFGYGADHNGALLREMASATEGGSYYFIEEDKDVGNAFGDALGGVLTMVAQNAVVTLEVPASARAMGVEIVKVKHDQIVRRENGSYTVTMGDFYAEETRDLVVTIKLAIPSSQQGRPVTQENEPITHASASLSYTDTVEARLVQGETVLVSIARPTSTNSRHNLSEENPYVASQVFRVHAAEQMEEAERMAAAGRYQEAQGTFTTLRMAYEQCAPAVQAMPHSMALHSDATELETCFANRNQYRTLGHAKLNSKLRSHKMQRTADSAATVPGTAGNGGGGGDSSAVVFNMAYKSSKKKAEYASKFA